MKLYTHRASTDAQKKKVATVPFCATPTPEAFECVFDTTGLGGGGAIQCNARGVDANTIFGVTPATGTHLSPLRSGTCAAVRGPWFNCTVPNDNSTHPLYYLLFPS